MSNMKPYLVVLGNKGVGKTYLLNDIIEPKEALVHNKNPEHVTINQSIVSPQNDDNIFAAGVDMVGLDTKEGNIVGLRGLYGRPLVFLYLNNDLRIKTSLADLSEKLGIAKELIHVFNSYAFKDVPENYNILQYEQIWKLGMAKLAEKSVVIKAPQPIKIETPLLSPEKNKTPSVKSTKLSKAARKLQFEKTNPFFGSQSVVANIIFKNETFNFVGQVKQLSLEDVQKHKRPGDSLLRLILERMVSDDSIDGPTAKQIESNATLKQFLVSQCTSEQAADLVLTLYGKREVSDEKYGDVVEALLHKTFNLQLLHDIIKHGRSVE